MKEHEITLAELFRVTNYMPEGWTFIIETTNDEASLCLVDPDGFDIEVYYDGDTSEAILDHVNKARKAEGMKPVDWNGDERDA